MPRCPPIRSSCGIWAGKVFTRGEAWRSMAFFIGHWQMRGYGHWAVEEKATGRMIGRIGFLNPEGWPGFEVGWTLARQAWGKGYATEGGGVALQYAFKELDQRHVISLIHPDNTPSMRVAERLGEKREGTARLGEWDVLVYGDAHDRLFVSASTAESCERTRISKKNLPRTQSPYQNRYDLPGDKSPRSTTNFHDSGSSSACISSTRSAARSLFPFFALYITGKFNVGMTEAGILLGLLSLAGILGSVVGGGLTDRLGRRKLILFGLVASAVSALTFGVGKTVRLAVPRCGPRRAVFGGRRSRARRDDRRHSSEGAAAGRVRHSAGRRQHGLARRADRRRLRRPVVVFRAVRHRCRHQLCRRIALLSVHGGNEAGVRTNTMSRKGSSRRSATIGSCSPTRPLSRFSSPPC